jgi:hypothetical protein
MKLWHVLIAIPAAVFTAFAQANPKVGVVLTIEGRWCRQATPLHGGDAVYLLDEIRYCASSLKKSDQITIVFNAAPDIKAPDNIPYKRTYSCGTLGICDENSKLWLLGAYTRSKSTSSGTPLISAPPTARALPDAIVE